MSNKKMKYIGEPREIVGFGVFKPGEEVDYDEVLFDTGLFELKTKSKQKDGEE